MCPCKVRYDTWISPFSQPCERAFVIAYLMHSSLNMDYSQREVQLLEAIERGQLDKVKQLLGSGVEANTVLHSKARRESATVLGTAAYEGQVDIVQYLIRERQLSVNYRDPCLGRNALQWACMGGHYLVVLALLNHQGIDVNRCDNDNVTPLIMASIYTNTNPRIINALISAGADVCGKDRLNASALHYASDGHSSEATEATVCSLIRAGCITSNSVVFGEGTVVANLFDRGFSPLCVKLLLMAGYTLPRGRPLMIMLESCRTHHQLEICLLLQEHKRPQSLRQICRARIRVHLGGIHLQRKLAKLPLPTMLIDYLLLQQL